MDNAIAVWFLGLVFTALYLFFTGNIGLSIFAVLLLFASMRIVNG